MSLHRAKLPCEAQNTTAGQWASNRRKTSLVVGSYGVFQSKGVSRYPWESTDGEFFRKKEVVATITKYADVFAGRKTDP